MANSGLTKRKNVVVPKKQQFQLPPPAASTSGSKAGKPGKPGKKVVLKHVDPPTLARKKKFGAGDTLDIPFFDRIVIVSLQKQNDDELYTPYISYSFPKISGPEPSPFLPMFCFPDANRVTEGSVIGSTYSFVLTDIAGDKQYGYCKRIRSRDHRAQLPEVYCILSKIGSFELYANVLTRLEDLHNVSEAAVHGFLNATISMSVPKPGNRIRVKQLNHKTGTLEDIEIERPLDGHRLEHVELRKLLQWLTINQVIVLFASVLFERRVLISCGYLHLSKLSSCVSSLATLIYPLKWECIYIPMLPRQMIEVVTAPTPYLIGAMTEDLPAVQREINEDEEPLVHFDLDTSTFLKCHGDEDSLLPNKSMSMLENELKALIHNMEDDVVADNTQISKVFLTFMYKILGHYKNHLIDYQGNREIDADTFVPNTRRYLKPVMEKLSGTQSFSVFTINVAGAGDYDQFKNFVEDRLSSRSNSLFSRTFS